MKLIVGLGNPGTKYLKNRHNVGQMLVDQINKNSNSIKAIKTDTFMNESGKFVAKVARNTGIQEYSNLYIVHDDLDIPLGQYKIQFGVGPKVHNGVASVERELGTKEFWRIRIGVDNRAAENRMEGEKYVLDDFSSEELEILEKVYAKIGNDLSRH